MGLPRLDSLGNYELLMELARGGMAELYLARILGIGGFEKLVAIKRILPHHAEDKLFRDMFLNEGRIAAQLSHQNICQVFHLDEQNGELFLVMEYLRGVAWDALIRELPRDRETLRLAAGVIAQACEGLYHAHELRDAAGQATPVIHRDVSPQNLFVTVDGVCKVLDFGVSKILKDGPRTRTGVLKGKLPYMAPEQIQGDPVDARSDVFALGVVLWEALSGVALFDRDTDFLIWKAITEAPIPPLAPHGFPPEIDAVLGSALARPRDERFRSARALGEAVRRAAEPIGGAYDNAEISAVVAARHGERIAARDRAVASVVTARRRSEPTAADTIEDHAASTVSLRTASVRQVSPQASPQASPQTLPQASLSMRMSTIDRPPMRARWPYALALVVAVASVTTLVLATRGDEDRPATVPAPPPVTSAAIAAPAPAAAAVPAPIAADPAPIADDGAAPDPDRTSTRRPARPAPKPRPAAGDRASSPTPTPVAPPPPADRPANLEPGTYSIDSVPYATVYLDGRELGDTPLFRQRVAAGKHTVRAVLADGQVRTFTIEVPPGKDVSSGKLTWPATDSPRGNPFR